MCPHDGLHLDAMICPHTACLGSDLIAGGRDPLTVFPADAEIRCEVENEHTIHIGRDRDGNVVTWEVP